MIDQDFVQQKLALLHNDLAELAIEYKQAGPTFYEDKRSRHVIEHLLEHIISRAIDINGHLLVESGQKPPETYEDSFLDLVKIKVLPKTLAESIAKSAGLRNRLVHDYDDLDYRLVQKSIALALKQYPRYIKQVLAFAKRR